MDRQLQCRCGKVRGVVNTKPACTRVVCYCKDCQAYANFLADPGDILDPLGGTDLVIVHPRQLSFTAGQEAIACMSLSERGVLRWYASCCKTPLANSSRNFKLAFVSLPHTCLSAGEQKYEEAFGPVRMLSFTQGARQPVPTSGLGAVLPMARMASSLLRARVSGSYRYTPLFKPDGTPIVAPAVITRAERTALTPR